MDTIKNVGKSMGFCEKVEITKTSVKIRVHINGLRPLITSSVVEYSNGDEAVAHLVYEKLERHCTTCMKLDQDISECPEAKHKKATHPHCLVNRGDHYEPAEKQRGPPPSYYRRGEKERLPAPNANPRPDREIPRTGDYSRSRFRDLFGRHESSGNHSISPPREHRRDNRGHKHYLHPENDDRRSLYSKTRPGRAERARLREGIDLTPSREDREVTSRTSRRRTETNDNLVTPPPALPFDAVVEAMGEVREVMVQYSNCDNPIESAARKERYRQGEESGQLLEAAVQMVQAAMVSQPNLLISPPLNEAQNSAARLSALSRLGPVNP
ncbi:hypothetical protein AALP_AAs58349U000200 [Arabis alpina]|uniref:Zinc knuckle CX2CX4HX4C domain-containing protein n=1 Tax=Arabis alpina TaxID=50452 RepID=A0A087G0D1_ARAAL|nr:hypothetical protein AALP_AAs58349U000200 [Arabis alpina]